MSRVFRKIEGKRIITPKQTHKHMPLACNSYKLLTGLQNCPPTLIQTLTLNQNLTLNGEEFSSGAIVRTPLIYDSLIF